MWIRKNCVPVTDGQPCGNCARHCPTGAITMVPLYPEAQKDGGKDEEKSRLMIPVVNEEMCIGCGGVRESVPFTSVPGYICGGSRGAPQGMTARAPFIKSIANTQ